MSSGLKQELEKYKRYIAIHEIARLLGHDICCLLPAFHAIAGCDSVSSFHGIGKKSGFSGPRNFSHKLLELKEFGAKCNFVSGSLFCYCCNQIFLYIGQ